ncbi:DNA LIGASE [Salix purpurea]|uniref:DNA LIGASE n=1 Tax=Salix purpurea TaxID=77065 RepID=A0A9Q0SPA1_SALPP|nr:DNA LIGASE [Salix purpurea]
MSRCFPYPPPGYYRIESIKIQKDKELSVTESSREAKKKEKKEGRKHRKDNSYQNGYYGGKSRQERKGMLPKEKREEAEKSDLTEEHNEPVCLQNACYLSDDGIWSNKKRRLNPSTTTDDKPRNVFRIRLPLTKHKEPDVSPNSKGLCSTSCGADSVSGQDDIVRLSDQETINSKAGKLASPPENIPCSSISEKMESSVCHESKTSWFRFHDRKMRKADSQYKSLIEDFVPRPLQFELEDSGDEDWLFGTLKQERHGNKRLNALHDASCRENSTLWPRAHYLPETDSYALPYTIPF